MICSKQSMIPCAVNHVFYHKHKRKTSFHVLVSIFAFFATFHLLAFFPMNLERLSPSFEIAGWRDSKLCLDLGSVRKYKQGICTAHGLFSPQESEPHP